MAELEAFLKEHVYRHPRLVRMDNKAKRFVHALFEAYMAEPKLLPPRFVDRIAELGAHRVICDYVAGMTGPVRPERTQAAVRTLRAGVDRTRGTGVHHNSDVSSCDKPPLEGGSDKRRGGT